jgi:broad specificity phosphatase PhoE
MTSKSWPKRLVLVRHAESRGNVADLRAHEARAARLELDARDADIGLSDTGRRQAAALGTWFADVDQRERPTMIVTSPYARASLTADLIAEAIGLPVPVQRDERLRERDLGMLDGLTGLGIRDLFPEEAKRRSWIGKFYYRPPGGESWCDVVLRVRSFLGTALDGSVDQRLLVVSHQAVILNFRFVLEGLSETELMDIDAGPPLANCSITTYDRDDAGELLLTAFNDVGPVATMDEPVTEEQAKDDKA